MPTPTTGTAFSFAPPSGYTSIDALIAGTKWGGALGTGVSLTYSFAASPTNFSYGDEAATFHSFAEVPANIASEVRQELTIWSAVANVTFVEVAESSGSVGDIRFSYASLGATFSGHAYLPGSQPSAGDVWFSWDVPYMKQNGPSDYSDRVETMTHEIGHALGLKHPFEGDVQLPAAIENDLYSVMSYTDERGTSALPVQDATPMLYDILAVQYLYGANYSFHSGDDIWTVGRFPQYGPLVSSNNGVRATIWDGGGNDTLVADSASSSLDLRQGAVSSSGAVGQAVIAFNTVIENATGGGFSDVIFGNEMGNVLRGMGGPDTVIGGQGDDWIEGDSGNDPLPFDGVQQVAGADNLAGGEGNDTVLAGGENDVVHGDSGEDLVTGEAGDDVIFGDDGNDALDGGAGGDTLYGGVGVDILFGDADGDSLYGGEGSDVMMGERGEDSGVGALDVLYGEAGNDQLDGGAGDDWIFGGDGADIIDGDYGSDYIQAGPGADIMLGSGASVYGPAKAGNDLFVFTSSADAGDQIWGFDTRPGEGDGLDVRALFDSAGYAGDTPRGDGYLYVFQNRANADIYVDLNGSTEGVNLTRLVTLHAVIAANLTDSYFLYQ